jgi:diguanylate cyclase
VKLIRRSDDAVYFSKEAGRNCGHWHDGDNFLPMNVVVNPKQALPENLKRLSPAKNSEQSVDNLPDQATFTDELQRRVAESHRFDVTLSTMHIVVKSYDELEEEYGNAVGKLLLDSVAQFIHSLLRDTDLLGMITPGEFAVMLPGSPEHEAKLVAARIQTAIASCTIPQRGKEIQLELLIGTCSVEPDDDAQSMLDRTRAQTMDQSKKAVPIG